MWQNENELLIEDIMTTGADRILTAKEMLLREVEALPDELVAEALDFVAFIKAKRADSGENSAVASAAQRQSTASSLLEFAGTWVGDDLQDCLDEVIALRE
jgi:hypothetical protein